MGPRGLPALILGLGLGPGPAALQTPEAVPRPRVLMVFVDGFLPGAIANTPTPSLDRLMRRAAWSLEARAESTTISGSGWSTFLTGVHWDKHGVPDNNFEAPNYARYPAVFSLLRQARPQARSASANCWRPIEDGLITPSRPDVVIFHDYDETSDDYWDEASCDTRMAEDLARRLREEDLDLAAILFGELDGVGHSEGNARYHDADPLYLEMLTRIDGKLGLLLAAIEGRESYRDEDWLVLVSTDHAGSQGRGHGENIPAHRRVPLIVSGRGVARGEIWPPPQPCDLVPTALAHLGVELRPEWDLDGVVLGRERKARPRAALGVNLIVNGGAEAERGFAGVAGVPDASLAAWDDPGAMTAVTYGSAGFPDAEDPRPPEPGATLFVGGPGSVWIEQRIDLSPLAAQVGSGLSFDLAGWLGGPGGQAGSTRLELAFHGPDGGELESYLLEAPGPPERGSTGGLWLRRRAGSVPGRAAEARVRLTSQPGAAGPGGGGGYADNLSLVLRGSD